MAAQEMVTETIMWLEKVMEVNGVLYYCFSPEGLEIQIIPEPGFTLHDDSREAWINFRAELISDLARRGIDVRIRPIYLSCDEYGYVSGYDCATSEYDSQPTTDQQPSMPAQQSLNDLATCEYCATTMPYDRLAQHIDKYHNQPASLGYEHCEHCGAEVQSSKIRHHYTSVHGIYPPSFDQKVPSVLRVHTAKVRKEKSKASTKRSSKLAKASASLIPCLYCTAKVRAHRLEKHIRKIHPHIRTSQAEKTLNIPVFLTTCPHCKCKVRSDRLEKHINKVHSQARSAQSSIPSQHDSNRLNELRFVSSETYRQAFYEDRDAGKYLGHMSRENGRFGSLSLYDGYADDDHAE